MSYLSPSHHYDEKRGHARSAIGDRGISSSHLGLTGTGAQDRATAGVAPPGTRALHASSCLVAQSGRGLASILARATLAGARPDRCLRRCLQCNGASVRMDHTGGLHQSISKPQQYANECHHVLVYCLTNGFTTPGLRQNVSTVFVHTNDLGSLLQSRMNASIASSNSGTRLKTQNGILLRRIS